MALQLSVRVISLSESPAGGRNVALQLIQPKQEAPAVGAGPGPMAPMPMQMAMNPLSLNLTKDQTSDMGLNEATIGTEFTISITRA